MYYTDRVFITVSLESRSRRNFRFSKNLEVQITSRTRWKLRTTIPFHRMDRNSSLYDNWISILYSGQTEQCSNQRTIWPVSFTLDDYRNTDVNVIFVI